MGTREQNTSIPANKKTHFDHNTISLQTAFPTSHLTPKIKKGKPRLALFRFIKYNNKRMFKVSPNFGL